MFTPSKKEIKFSAIFNSSAFFIRALLSAILSIFLIRFLNEVEYGIYTSVMSIIVLSEAFAELGFGVSSSRAISKQIASNKEIGIAIEAGLFLRITFSLILMILFYFFRNILFIDIIKLPVLTEYSSYIIIGFFLSSFSSYIGRLLQGLHLSSFNSLVVFLNVFLFFSISLYLCLFLNLKIIGVFIGYLSSRVITILIMTIIMLVILKKNRIYFNFNKMFFSQVKSIFIYSIPLSFTAINYELFYQLPVILLGRFTSDPVIIGKYGMALKITTIFILPARALIFSISSAIVHLFDTAREKLKDKIYSINLLSLKVFIPLTVFIIIASKALIMILNSAYYDSYHVLQILSFLIVINALVLLYGGILSFIGYAKIEMIGYFISTILLLLLGSILYNKYELEGLALSVVISALANLVLIMIFLRNIFKIPLLRFRDSVLLFIYIFLVIIVLYSMNSIFNHLFFLIIGGIFTCIIILLFSYKDIIKFSMD